MEVGGARVEEEEDAGYQVEGEESGEEGAEDGGRKADAGGRGWVVFAVLFIFQLTLPSVLWSYGILLSRMVEHDDVRFHVALWTPALFLATACLTDPWFRLPVVKGSSGKKRRSISTWMLRPMSVAGILLVAGSLAVTPYIRPRELHLVTCGVLSGLGTSLALTQSELLMEQYFPPRRKRRRRRVLSLATIRFGSSLSQFVSPLLMMAVIESYGRHQAPLLQSGYVLQALIAAALIKFRSTGSTNTRANVRMRSMSYSIMEEDDGTEDTEWRCGPQRISEGDTLLPFEEDPAGRSWKNPAKDETTTYDLKDEDDEDAEDASESADDPVSNVLGHPKRRNCYGVEILPQIPEETEEEDSGDARQSKRSSRRLTITIPNNNNNNNNHKDPSAIENPTNGSNFHNGNYLPDTPTSASSTTFLITPNKGLRKYKRWKWRRRKWRRRRMRKEEEDVGEDEEGKEERGAVGCVREVIDPRGFCKASFYPALALSASSKLGNLVFFSMIPHVARLLGKSKNDSTLLVSLAGFSSLLMAAVIPLISLPSPKAKVAGFFAPRTCKKFVYSIGSITSAIALFLLSRCDTYDRLTLASLLFGIGSGATADAAGSILHVAYGGWESVNGSRGLINTLSSFIILAFTASIGVYISPAKMEVINGVNGSGVGSLTVCFSIVAIFQFMAGITWSIQPILSRFYSRQRNYLDWNNGMFLQTT